MPYLVPLLAEEYTPRSAHPLLSRHPPATSSASQARFSGLVLWRRGLTAALRRTYATPYVRGQRIWTSTHSSTALSLLAAPPSPASGRERSGKLTTGAQNDSGSSSHPVCLSGYAVGLVQLFRDVPCPDLLARYLLDLELEDWRECARSYMRHLVLRREDARVNWETEEVEQLDVEIHEHAIHEQIPKRWNLDTLFSRSGYETYGDGHLAVWATILIQLCTLEQYWEGVLLGYPPENPYLLPGFHPDSEVLDTAWLEEARCIWSGDLRASVLPSAAKVLAIVVLPPEPDEELHDVLETEPAAAGPWVN